MGLYCEYCNNKIINKYASGRFCNIKCSKGFSTKAKRNLINAKVSKKLGGDYDYSKLSLNNIKEAIINTSSMFEASKYLNVTYNAFITNSKKYNLYKPNQGGKGILRVEIENILCNSNIKKKGDILKKVLLYSKIKTYNCEICNINDWNNKKLVLEIDHINGINTDNRVENLRLLCPNCHSQTDTFRRKKSFFNK